MSLGFTRHPFVSPSILAFRVLQRNEELGHPKYSSIADLFTEACAKEAEPNKRVKKTNNFIKPPKGNYEIALVFRVEVV